MTRIIIAGGGLAGCLAALALVKKRPDVDVLLIEQGSAFGGNRTWSYFDTDIADDGRWLIDGIGKCHWPRHSVRFPKRRRIIDIGYNSIRSADLDAAVRARLRPEQFRLSTGIKALAATSVILADGTTIDADAVIDARGPRAMPGLERGWQKFVGRIYRYPRPHGVSVPVIMDAEVPQTEGYRFIYTLPVSETDLLIEDTYYANSPDLGRDELRAELDRFAEQHGTGAEMIDEEEGILPVVMGGEVTSLWPSNGLVRLGLQGGYFHPTTGYSLPDAVANAVLLAEQSKLSSAALFSLFRDRAIRLWEERGFFRLLNRMLFRGTEPDQSYRVLEHFYRLPPPLIARFYAARLTALDKLRILSGKPPVPIGRAVRALWRSAA